jgi:predicted extracellular nuclease
MSTVSYLDRFLEPVTEAFTPEFARHLVELRADDELQAEVDVLRQKSNEGTLTPEEEVSYKDFVEAVDVISIIQSKARRFLASHPAENGRSHP